MAENLKVIHYPDGTAIPNVTNNVLWEGLDDNNTDDAYCYLLNNENHADTYGALYTYAAAIGDNWERDNAENQGICPNGWHLPTDDEWKELEMYLGMSQSEADNIGARGTNEGSKLAGNASHWRNGALGNDPDFNTSGFKALPCGARWSEEGTFFGEGGGECYFISATIITTNPEIWIRGLDWNNPKIARYTQMKSTGLSVRCLRN